MAKYDMCDQMYSSLGGKVIAKNKPLTTPLLVLLGGMLLFAINGFLIKNQEFVNLKSALVLFGSALTLVGGTILGMRLFGRSTAPYCTKPEGYLKREELKFTKEQKAQVLGLIQKGEFDTLRAMPQSDISTLMVAIYSSHRSPLQVAQAFEYIDLELRPISPLKILE